MRYAQLYQFIPQLSLLYLTSIQKHQTLKTWVHTAIHLGNSPPGKSSISFMGLLWESFFCFPFNSVVLFSLSPLASPLLTISICVSFRSSPERERFVPGVTHTVVSIEHWTLNWRPQGYKFKIPVRNQNYLRWYFLSWKPRKLVHAFLMRLTHGVPCVCICVCPMPVKELTSGWYVTLPRRTQCSRNLRCSAWEYLSTCRALIDQPGRGNTGNPHWHAHGR